MLPDDVVVHRRIAAHRDRQDDEDPAARDVSRPQTASRTLIFGCLLPHPAGMTVTVRFAPSPTGFLHIGGARTALFNWLFARHHGGVFRLRIEDTDRERSTPEAVAAIIDGLELARPRMGRRNRPPIRPRRASRRGRAAIAAAGRAYNCYCTPAELEAMREKARAEKRRFAMTALGATATRPRRRRVLRRSIRLKAPQHGSTTIRDRVQGEVTVANTELDDLIILRADGTPTYNLSVVVDDHDMAITHVIRGDDHLNNAFRQTQIYRALDWPVPEFAHVPLIHGPDGAKMSKRHGALGVDAYREMGYLPEALRNYLLRLGWSHGDDEIIIDRAGRRMVRPGCGRPRARPLRFCQARQPQRTLHSYRRMTTALIALVAERLEKTSGRPLTESRSRAPAEGDAGAKPRPKRWSNSLITRVFWSRGGRSISTRRRQSY